MDISDIIKGKVECDEEKQFFIPFLPYVPSLSVCKSSDLCENQMSFRVQKDLRLISIER